jgi:hypothetical protein
VKSVVVPAPIRVAGHVRVRLDLEPHPLVLAGQNLLVVEQQRAILALQLDQVEALRRREVDRERLPALRLQFDTRELDDDRSGRVDGRIRDADLQKARLRLTAPAIAAAARGQKRGRGCNDEDSRQGRV